MPTSSLRLFLAVLLALPVAAQSYADEREVAQLLADAELQSSKGRNKKAVTLCRSLSRKYPVRRWIRPGSRGRRR